MIALHCHIRHIDADVQSVLMLIAKRRDDDLVDKLSYVLYPLGRLYGIFCFFEHRLIICSVEYVIHELLE